MEVQEDLARLKAMVKHLTEKLELLDEFVHSRLDLHSEYIKKLDDRITDG